jgi:hypothetical protein
MKTHRKTSFGAAIAIVVAAASLHAVGQTTDSSTSTPFKATPAKAADFQAKEQAMQAASKSASGAVTTPTSEAAGYNRNKDAGKNLETQTLNMFIPKGSAPVDKSKQATSPIKDISKMTAEERNQLRREVQKDAKP